MTSATSIFMRLSRIDSAGFLGKDFGTNLFRTKHRFRAVRVWVCTNAKPEPKKFPRAVAQP